MARIEANGLGFEVSVEGAGTPVVLLHGFPDTSVMWRHQVAALNGAGFRTIAPDTRGRGRSDKPTAVAIYAMTKLVGDVIGIMDGLGIARAHVVGHDWGAALAWVVAMFAPDRVDHLVAISVGCPGAAGPPTLEAPEGLVSDPVPIRGRRRGPRSAQRLVPPARAPSERRRGDGSLCRHVVRAWRADRGPQLVPRQCSARPLDRRRAGTSPPIRIPPYTGHLLPRRPLP